MKLEDEQEDAKIMITLFLMYMQENGLWPYKKHLGKDPERASTAEVFAARDEFIKEQKRWKCA